VCCVPTPHDAQELMKAKVCLSEKGMVSRSKEACLSNFKRYALRQCYAFMSKYICAHSWTVTKWRPSSSPRCHLIRFPHTAFNFNFKSRSPHLSLEPFGHGIFFNRKGNSWQSPVDSGLINGLMRRVCAERRVPISAGYPIAGLDCNDFP
jgi:hypothetical protein